MIKIIQLKDYQGKVYPKTYKKLFKATQTINTLINVGVASVLLQRVDINKGNAFKLENGKIKALKPMKYAKLNFVAWIERYAGSYAIVYLHKNGETLSTYMLGKAGTGQDAWDSVSVSTIVQDIKPNDILGATIYFNVSSPHNGTRGQTYAESVYMIIEEIE